MGRTLTGKSEQASLLWARGACWPHPCETSELHLCCVACDTVWSALWDWSSIVLQSQQAVRLTAGCLPGAGATLVELYTGLAYEGPALVPRLKKQLAACLEADGFTSVQDAIGYDHRK